MQTLLLKLEINTAVENGESVNANVSFQRLRSRVDYIIVCVHGHFRLLIFTRV